MDDVALLASIIDNPGEDTPRLVYADWLDEQGCERIECSACRNGKYCPRCSGEGCSPHGVAANGRCLLNWCWHCNGSGTIIDPGLADRAELIRVQCELGRTNPAVLEMIAGCPDHIWEAKEYYRAKSLRSRESAILAAHPEWFPDCPVCKGNGLRPGRYTYTNGKSNCEHCNGTGCVGAFARGFLDSVKVPTIADVLEPCVNCEARDLPCPLCVGWQPTTYATELIREYPMLRSVVPVDRIPTDYDMSDGTGRTPHVFAWFRGEWRGENFNIIEVIWDALDKSNAVIRGQWADYPTPEFATDALGVAILNVMKGK